MLIGACSQVNASCSFLVTFTGLEVPLVSFPDSVVSAPGTAKQLSALIPDLGITLSSSVSASALCCLLAALGVCGRKASRSAESTGPLAAGNPVSIQSSPSFYRRRNYGSSVTSARAERTPALFPLCERCCFLSPPL